MKVKILGQVYAVVGGVNPPTNTKILWYDSGENLLKFYSKSGWIAIISNNLGLVSLTEGDTPGYLNTKINSTLKVSGGKLGVSNPLLYGVNQETSSDGSYIVTMDNKYNILEINGGTNNVNIIDVICATELLENGFELLIINTSQTNNLFFHFNTTTYLGFNGGLGNSFIHKGSNVTISSPTSVHSLYPFESMKVIKISSGRWYIADVFEVKKTAFNKNFGTTVGTIPEIGQTLSANSAVITDSLGKLKT